MAQPTTDDGHREKIKALYTRMQTLEKRPTTDVATTVSNFMDRKEMKYFPAPIRHGIEEEADAKQCYTQMKER